MRARPGYAAPAGGLAAVAVRIQPAWEAGWMDDQGQDARLEAATAKLYCTEMGFRVADQMMQVLGAMEMSREVPLEGRFPGPAGRPGGGGMQ